MSVILIQIILHLFYSVWCVCIFQTFTHMHATTETQDDSVAPKASVRGVENQYATRETESEAEARPHVKTVGDQHISQTSKDEAPARPHTRY